MTSVTGKMLDTNLMNQSDRTARFQAKLLRPAKSGDDPSWAFVVIPKAESEKLPRRGKTTVTGTMNGQPFQATLDPDGQLSHWLKVDLDLQEAAGVRAGDMITLEIAPVEQEPEPEIPQDLDHALNSNSAARRVWLDTTAVARLDWIHWITSAKQAKTREKRICDACAMLAAGKKRVCCFDSSGYYSKAFTAPKPHPACEA
ncbi:MAG TPA: YdeI/OmpD-associated family protein [Luteolibacter sp.]